MNSKLNIDVTLASQLIKEQFPQWAALEIRSVAVQGHDNRTFRLGNKMLIRLPSAQCYAAKVAIEQKWLPKIVPHLSWQIPNPIAQGSPSNLFPFPWSIYQWIEGESINTVSAEKLDMQVIALQLASFLQELHRIDTTDAPIPGLHNFWRGGDLAIYDAETRSALQNLKNIIDGDQTLKLWKKALDSKWTQAPVWLHGDLAPGNILIKDKQITGIIDWGGMAIGDPACDLVIAWTSLDASSRKFFKKTINLDEQTWNRARGWALWKALITLEKEDDKQSKTALKQQKTIHILLHKEA